jgi:type III pantothenate kinase
MEQMLLAVDIGNTDTLFALFEGEQCRGEWRLSTQATRTADEYTIWLSQFLAGAGLSLATIKECVIACVVPRCVFPISQMAERLLQRPPLVVTRQVMEQIGVVVAVERPDEVGADRMINALAAWHLLKQAAIVLDFGTATTFDVVTQTGSYAGGVIAPGINLSLEALHRAAAKLPNIAIKPPLHAIGRNTEAAMQAGIYYGYLGLIERIIREIKTEMTAAGMGMPVVLATGGLGGLFSKATPMIERYVPDLTVLGLRVTAARYAEIVTCTKK